MKSRSLPPKLSNNREPHRKIHKPIDLLNKKRVFMQEIGKMIENTGKARKLSQMETYSRVISSMVSHVDMVLT